MFIPKLLILLAVCTLTTLPCNAGVIVFINEIHYENTGQDTNELIEVAGPAGTDLTGWSLLLYDGATGQRYSTHSLQGTLLDTSNGFGFTSERFNGGSLGNGPDGIALVNASSEVIQFLSYEGTFTATDGPAINLTSTDIGLSESSGTPVGSSLQLIGAGTVYEDFTWSLQSQQTDRAVNINQTFLSSVPEPSSCLALTLMMIASCGRRGKRDSGS